MTKDLKIGDKVIGFESKTCKNEIDTIKNVWDNGKADVYNIITRTGRNVLVTDNHPFYKIYGWVEAKDLTPGDLIALSNNNSCAVSDKKVIDDYNYIIAAYLLAEGSIGNRSMMFSNVNIDYVKELGEALKCIHKDIKLINVPSRVGQYRIKGLGSGLANPVRTWLEKYSLFGKTSAYKFHPDFIWDLNKHQICDYLRIWWNTDGYWHTNKHGSHYVCIALISEQLVKGIQELLLKLGIHSTINVYVPKIYKNTDKKIYKLAIEGQKNISKFYKLVNTDKKPTNLIFRNERHNSLVMDKIFVDKELSSINKKDKEAILYRSSSSLTYSFEKVARICKIVNLPNLKKIVDSDIYFDKVTKVEYIGKLQTTAIETEKTNTFQIDNLITHNTSKSSTLANLMIINSAVIPHHQSLYISPTVDQTKVFSHDRINPVLETSPIIKDHYMSSSLVQNVFMKQFLNGSRMYLRYALQTADRIRGYCLLSTYEYLTYRGWIKVADINENDLVLTKNDKTSEFEFQKPIEIKEYEYEGPIHKYKSRNQTLLEVTPDHRLHLSKIKFRNKGPRYNIEWETGPSSNEMKYSNFRMGISDLPKQCTYKGKKAPDEIVFSEFITDYKADGTKYANNQLRIFPAVKVPTKEFMIFMGWWLAEGWVCQSNSRIGIAQSKEHNPIYWQEINNLMEDLFPDNVLSKDKNTWILNNKYRALYEYLKPLGKSHERYIPRELLEYTEYLPDLLDALYKGDGENSVLGRLRLTTKSKRLADSSQEAWLRLGQLASICYDSTIDLYTIGVLSRTFFNFLLGQPSTHRSKRFDIYQYKGKVHCLVTPNGNFVCRNRTEKVPLVTGNSADMNLFDECFLPNMEVKTNQGWKLFSELDETELIASYNSDKIEYQKPSRYIKKDYKGRVFNFFAKDLKVSVTENHNMITHSNMIKKVLAKNVSIKDSFILEDGNTIKISSITIGNYEVKVYCVTVPNGTIIVRDKFEKTAVVCGNCQDLRADIIPVVKETMSRSLFKKSLFAGTPKRTQGTLADIWASSSRNEYAIKCEHCPEWNILGEDNIGLTGPICIKCGLTLNVKKGQWVSTYDSTRPIPPMEGYRVCLLHFHNAPWVNWAKDIIYKYENSKKGYFYNEVLALEYDEGAAPLTIKDVAAACDPEKEMTEELTPLEKSYPCIMGIDYGPVNSEESHTIITVLQQRNKTVYLLYAKRFIGKEADYSFIHKEIPRLMKKYNVNHLAADYGMGEASNSEIRSKVGFQRVIAFQHIPSQKEKVRWNNKMPAYTLNRNQVMTEFFARVKKGKLKFPRFEDTKSFANDMLNVQMEFDEERNTMRYITIGPDDFVHACIFALVALELFYGIVNTV